MPPRNSRAAEALSYSPVKGRYGSSYVSGQRRTADVAGPSSKAAASRAKTTAPSPYRPQRTSTQQFSRHARNLSDSGSSSCDPTSEDETDSPDRPFRSRESTGNHHLLAATTTMTQMAPRAAARPRSQLPAGALEMLDQYAAASASDSERSNLKHQPKNTRRQADDSCEPTYEFRKAKADSIRQPETVRPVSPQGHRLNRRPLSPGSPSPAPSLRGFGGSRLQGGAPPAPSAFENFAKVADQLERQMKEEEEQRRRRAQTSREARDSSAETLVDEPVKLNAAGFSKVPPKSVLDLDFRGQCILPSGMTMGHGAPAGLILPDDITGVTSALASPLKARVGVKHPSLHSQVGKTQLNGRRAKLDELRTFVSSIEEELETTKDRLEGVERREDELRGDVRQIREEWRDYGKSQQRASKASRQQNPPNKDGDWANKMAAMSAHVAALSEDLEVYRAAVEDMHRSRSADEESRTNRLVKQKIKAQPQSLHAVETEEEAEQAEYTELHQQVKRLELEVARLQKVVDRDGGTTLRPPVPSKQARVEDWEAEGEIDMSLMDHQLLSGASKGPKSKTAKSGRVSPMSAPFNRRKLTFAAAPQTSSSRPSSRGRSDEFAAGFDSDYPRSSTLPLSQSRPSSAGQDQPMNGETDPETEGAEKSSRRTLRKPRVSDSKETDDDMTVAQARVDQTLRSLMQSTTRVHNDDEDVDVSASLSSGRKHSGPALSSTGHGLSARDLIHDSQNCTVCSAAAKRDSRRASRRARVMANVRRQEVGSLEEDLLLSLLSPNHPASSPLSLQPSQLTLLHSLLKSHLDEFLHSRMLYSELADELKKLDPNMEERKRKILIEHVLEAVEELEIRCRRIGELRRLLPVEAEEKSMGRDGANAREREKDNQPIKSVPAASLGTTSTSSWKKKPNSSSSTLKTKSSAQAQAQAQAHPYQGPATLSRALANSPPQVGGAAA